MEWSFLAAERLVAALRAGEVTSVELTEEAIARIERTDEMINAICVPDFDRALAAAHRADEARARGEDRPLLGIPVTVKESCNIAGLPTTWGMRDIQSFNEIYGTTNNPWDHSRTSGGSSGGSAAALAAGFGALSIGSDLAGSLRTPAHFCGVYAHKPTLGLAPTRGMVAPPTPALPIDLDLAVVGPMARTARDLTLLLDVMAGPDPLTHGIAYHAALPTARHERLSDFRVLILEDHPFIATGSAVRAAVNRVAEALVDEGAHVERRSPLLPDPTEAATLYMQLMLSNAAASLPLDVYEQLQTRAAGLSANDRSLDAARLRGMVLSHRDWVEVNNRRELHRHGWRQLFAEFDAVVCPVTPTPAFPHDHNGGLENRHIDIDGVRYPYFDQLVWAGVATMPGLPATAIPAGRSPTGLPVGVQLIGPMFEDRTPLRLAELLEEKIGGFRSVSDTV
ncbi:amidase [Nocardia sp. MW-W600-9]